MTRRRTLAALLAVGLLCCLEKVAPAAAESGVSREGEKAVVVYAPQPSYPDEARQKFMTGSGVVVMEIDLPSGRVTRAYMQESTGYPLLDNETIATFQKWRFKPGTVSRLRSPINFALSGVRTYPSYEFKEKPMDDVLARYLGKGAVLKGPMPAYPSFHPWTWKEGSGIYELHAGADGRVNEVKILKSSGDETFDKVASKSLHKWIFRRGPLTLELPLSFKLRPDKFSIAVAR